LFCKRESKCTEILYVQLFFSLKEHKKGAQTPTMVCKNIPKEGHTSKILPVAFKGVTSSPLPKGSEESGHPSPMAPLPPYLAAFGCYSLKLGPRGRTGSPEESMSPSD
jgi:hypothetical protein